MKILLVGCGNIGLSLLKVWVAEQVGAEIIIVQPSMKNSADFSDYPYIKFLENVTDIPKSFMEDLMVMAVKPQNLQAIAPFLKDRNSSSIIVSTLAGVTLDHLKVFLPKHEKIVRIMPNVALKTRNSINLAFAPEAIKGSILDIFNRAFQPSGPIFFLDEEKHLDQLTPIAGSGPAYIFLLAELLRAEVINMGIPKDAAKGLIDRLFKGSTSLIENDMAYETLIQSVTSKKGVTEAALSVMRPAMEQVIKTSLDAAFVRLRELSDETRH